MSDTSDSAPIEATEAAGAEPVESTPVESTSVLDRELPEGLRTFDRDYVEKTRAEAAANRTKAREFEAQAAEFQAKLARYQAFENYTDEDMVVWGGMAKDWEADPAVAARTFQQIAVNVLGDPNSTEAERADAQAILDNPVVAQEGELITPDKVRDLIREETTAAQEAARSEEAVANVFKEIEEAGYAEGTAEMFSVLWYANNKTNGDIAGALKMQKDYEQGIVDKYVAAMAKGGTPVRLPSNGDAGSPAPEGPKSINEARTMAEEWLRERQASA